MLSAYVPFRPPLIISDPSSCETIYVLDDTPDPDIICPAFNLPPTGAPDSGTDIVVPEISAVNVIDSDSTIF